MPRHHGFELHDNKRVGSSDRSRRIATQNSRSRGFSQERGCFLLYTAVAVEEQQIPTRGDAVSQESNGNGRPSPAREEPSTLMVGDLVL